MEDICGKTIQTNRHRHTNRQLYMSGDKDSRVLRTTYRTNHHHRLSEEDENSYAEML